MADATYQVAKLLNREDNWEEAPWEVTKLLNREDNWERLRKCILVCRIHMNASHASRASGSERKSNRDEIPV